jgi:hypothetical protein
MALVCGMPITNRPLHNFARHDTVNTADSAGQEGTQKKQMVKPRPSSFLTNAMIGVLRELRELAAKEQDAAKLGELVVEINCLLNVIEIQLAEVEGGGKPTSH